jgi:3-isopropylmalate dehydrogenase
MIYRKEEVERIAHLAFEMARKRKKLVTSVDKANVLEVSSFWRKIVSEVAQKYPDIKFEHAYVDAMTYYIILNPQKFDVVLCPNLFGDIISDEAGGIIGSLGLCPSASLGSLDLGGGRIQGLYEPVHGSAPDIAGKSIANPIATLLSASMLCEYSLGMKEEGNLIETAIRNVLSEGFRTQDLLEKKSQDEKKKSQKGKRGKTKIKVVSTKEFGDAVVKSLKKLLI